MCVCVFMYIWECYAVHMWECYAVHICVWVCYAYDDDPHLPQPLPPTPHQQHRPSNQSQTLPPTTTTTTPPKKQQQTFPHRHDPPAAAAATRELLPYLTAAFGHPTRIDYGTGQCVCVYNICYKCIALNVYVIHMYISSQACI